MNKTLITLLTATALAACAPTTQKVAPTTTNTSATYTTVIAQAGADNPVLAAVVALAPTAQTQPNRQPWRAETIEKNQVVLRSRATTQITSTLNSFMATLPYEMLFNVIREHHHGHGDLQQCLRGHRSIHF